MEDKRVFLAPSDELLAFSQKEVHWFTEFKIHFYSSQVTPTVSLKCMSTDCAVNPLSRRPTASLGKPLNMCEFYVCYLTLIYVCVF